MVLFVFIYECEIIDAFQVWKIQSAWVFQIPFRNHKYFDVGFSGQIIEMITKNQKQRIEI